MKLHSCLSGVRAIALLLVTLLFANCKKEDISIQAVPSELNSTIEHESLALSGLSQTKSGNRFNDPIPYDMWSQANPQYFSADDNSYAISKKLSSGQSPIPIILQDFRFEIPSNAIIQSIAARSKRFKTGKGTIGDYTVSLITQIERNSRSSYGVLLLFPGSLIPNTETEIIYAQNGAGDNGGLPDSLGHYKPYQWTPAMINNPSFGIWINHLKPNGSVVVYYDLVEIKVYYSLP